MSLFGNIGHFLGNLFNGDDEKKKKQQQQQQQSAYKPSQGPTQSFNQYSPQQPSSQPSQSPQLPNNGVNLVLPGQNNSLINNPLKKAQSVQPVPAVQTPDSSVTNDGPLRTLTHNPLTDTVGSIAKSGGRLAKAAAYTPQMLAADISGNAQAQANTQRKVFGTTDSGEIGRKIVGDVANVGLTIAAPGIDNVAARIGGRIAPEATGFAANTLRKVAPKVVSNAGIGSAFGASQAYGDGGSASDVKKAAETGAAIGGAGGALFGGVPLLRRAGKAPSDATALEETAIDAGAPTAARELAPGVKSANPTMEADAAAQQAQEAAQQQQNAARQITAEAPPAPRQATTGPDDLNVPAYQRRQPATAAQASAQNELNVNNVPDETFNADARIIGDGAPPSAVENALDVPTFLRRGDPEAMLQKANTDIATLDSRANDIRQTTSPTQSFDDKQAIAAAFRESPEKGRAVANLIASRGERTDPEAALKATLIARQSALRDAEQAQAAIGANKTLSEARTPVQAADATPLPVAPPASETAIAPVEPSMPIPSDPLPVSDAPPATQVAAATAPPEQLASNIQPQSPPVLPEPPSTPVQTVASAPRTHDALVKQLGPVAKDLKGKYSDRTPINIEDLKQNAAGVIANMSDDEVLRSFSTSAPDVMVRDSQSFALARAALERLGQNADDPAAVQTVTNIMDAMDRYVSKSGQGLRVAQEEFDNLPLPMKVRYIAKKIDSANADVEGYVPLADDPAKAAQIEANITGYLKGSQQINERVAQIQGQLNEIADSALQGQRTDTNVKGLVNSLKTEQRNLAANNGELVKYYSDLVPGRSKGQKINDFARRMMLASFTGRVNDLLTTGANIANLSTQNVTQGLLSKAVNLVKPGTVTDTLRGGSKLFTGGAEGLRKTAGEIKGTQYAPNLEKSFSSNTDLRTGLQKARGPVGRTIQAATEAATNLSEGVRDQRVYQLAVQEGQQSGLKGKMLDVYAEARAAVPTRQMQESADQLHREVNNLNENPITHTLNRVASSIEGKSAIGGFVKNQVMPFTSWLGGNIWNTITDKNVVASFVKTLDSVSKGDAEGVVRNLAKTANNAAYTYALGFLLTKAGIITNKDAQGYNDAGAYFHIGDRYIPVGFAGFFAPSVILGNAAYNGMANSGGSAATAIAKTAEQTLTNLAQSVNLTGALGADNNLTRALAAGQRPGASAGDAVATFAGGAAGQFVPGLAGDANAVLNNGLSAGGLQLAPDTLNPTHEAADTKVTELNPSTGRENKNYVKSAVASLKNRIPFLSQQLPRKANVAAADLTDRTTRGNRDTVGGKEARATAQAVVNQSKDFKTRGIPDPNGKNFDDAVKARTEDGNYDAAIEGLQAKLKDNQKNKDVPQSKNKAIEDQLKTLKVTKNGGFEPSVIDLYKKTSLSEWRDMGDAESDNYDPKTYALLYKYDSALAKEGVSRNTTKAVDNFYFAKAPKKASGKKASSAARSALASIQSNKIGNTPDLGKISFGDLSPQKIDNAKIPTIQQVKAGDLIKKRAISVGKA